MLDDKVDNYDVDIRGNDDDGDDVDDDYDDYDSDLYDDGTGDHYIGKNDDAMVIMRLMVVT